MMRSLLCGLASVLLLSGCGSKDTGGAGGSANQAGRSDPAALAEARKLVVESEPPSARGVCSVRESAKDGDEVVIAGRVGGLEKPFTDGRAAFLIVDPKHKPSEECDIPWDYCELDRDELAASRAHVKFVDAQGKTLHADARDAFGIKELSLVVVKGKASRDEKGNLTVVASGLFVAKDKP